MDTHTNDHVQDLFASRGLRCTKQRRAIYDALASTTSHPTADQLYKDVSGRVTGLSLATVYNTLEAFCQAGLAQKMPGGTSSTGSGTASARYDATVDNHLHVRCARTGEVIDVPHDLSDRLLGSMPREVIDELERRLGFQIDQVQIELVGQPQREAVDN